MNGLDGGEERGDNVRCRQGMQVYISKGGTSSSALNLNALLVVSVRTVRYSCPVTGLRSPSTPRACAAFKIATAVARRGSCAVILSAYHPWSSNTLHPP